MLTIIVAVIPVMTTVAYNHHPPTIIGAKDSGVPAVMISVIISAHDPRAPLMVFPVVISILTSKRKGRTG